MKGWNECFPLHVSLQWVKDFKSCFTCIRCRFDIPSYSYSTFASFSSWWLNIIVCVPRVFWLAKQTRRHPLPHCMPPQWKFKSENFLNCTNYAVFVCYKRKRHDYCSSGVFIVYLCVWMWKGGKCTGYQIKGIITVTCTWTKTTTCQQ